MGPLEDFGFMFFFGTVIVPALLIIILLLFRLKAYLAYLMRKWAYYRMPEESMCTICLESLKSGGLSAIYRLTCDHWFHKDCLRNWINENNNCPNCRCAVEYWNGRWIEPPYPEYVNILVDDANDDNVPSTPRTLWPNRRLPLPSYLQRRGFN